MIGMTSQLSLWELSVIQSHLDKLTKAQTGTFVEMQRYMYTNNLGCFSYISVDI